MVLKKDIEKLVINSKVSNLKTHWRDSRNYNSTKYSGEIRQNEILLWTSSYFLRSAYPIFKFTFDQNENLISLKLEKNPYEILLDKISIGFLVVFCFFSFMFTDYKTALFLILWIFFVGILFRIIIYLARKNETKLIIEELKNKIEKIEHKSNPSRKVNSVINDEKVDEWTFSKIMTRIIAYPFCILVFWICLTGLVPEGKIIQGVFGAIIALIYPVTDVLILMGKK